MAKSCYITGRKIISGNNRSYAMNASRRTWKANLQKIKIVENGEVKTVYVSARALKKNNLTRA